MTKKTQYQIKKDRAFDNSYKKHYKQLKEGLWDVYQEVKLNGFKGTFKKFIRELSNNHKGRVIETRVQGILRREEFISKEQRGINNIIKGLKEQGDYKEFKKFYGWKRELNPDELVYDKKLGIYKYTKGDKTYGIKVSNEGGDSQTILWQTLIN